MGSPREVSKDETMTVFPRVAEVMAGALARDLQDIALESRLIEDLDAESIDFLDIVFRLEQVFKIRIQRGQIVEDARGALSEEEFEVDGHLTDAGLERLREYLNEVPAERFRPGLRLAEVPLLFTVETFCKVVVRAQHSGTADS